MRRCVAPPAAVLLYPSLARALTHAHTHAHARPQAQRWVEGVTGEKFKASFHDSLKSGVLLCRLVNKIKPGSVPENRISLSNMPFNQRENVTAYLDACRRLGVREADMFVTADLFEGNNLVAVVNNLYALGGVAQVRR